MRHRVRMVILKRFPDSMTANIAKSVLMESGIESFVADENLANADPPVVFASGGVRLMVADEDRERAAAILVASTVGNELPDDFDPGHSDDIPPRFAARPGD
jgi:hypothetical protein